VFAKERGEIGFEEAQSKLTGDWKGDSLEIEDGTASSVSCVVERGALELDIGK